MSEEYEMKDFAKLLKHGALEGRRWMRSSDSEAVRIYDRNLEAFPVTVELYGKWAKIVDYSVDGLDDKMRECTIDLVNRMAYIERERIVFQHRRKRVGIEQHTLQSDEKVLLDVKEGGLTFRVDLTSHIDTGLFLDQAMTRDYVRSIAQGMRVLNLFSYTGSFSVYAAAGGAESVTSVDMSNTYSEVCRANLAANGFLDEKRFEVVTSDCGPFIDRALEEKRFWDIVIFDPPSFSNSHKMERPFDVKKDYLSWIARLSRLMGDHALLIFSCNSSTFALDKSALKRSFRISEVSQEMSPVGFVRSRGGTSRIWLLEKLSVFDADVRPRADRKEYVKRIEDDDFDRLLSSLEKDGQQEEGEERGRKSDRPRYEGRPAKRDEGYRPRRREDERPRYGRRDDGYRPRRRDDDGYRPSYRGDDDYRPRRRDDDGYRPSYRRDDDYRPRRRDDDGYRPSYRRDDDYRPRRRDDDGYRPSYRRDDDHKPRRRDDERPRYAGKDGERGESRARSHAYDKARRERRRSEVKPYGYDNIKKSRRRDDESQD